MNKVSFSFSDTIAGYIESVVPGSSFVLRTSDGRLFDISLTPATSAEMVYNLGDPSPPAPVIADALIPGRFLYAYGVFQANEKGCPFEALRLIFPSRGRSGYVFEQPDWWINQARSISDFYLRAQFPDGDYNWQNYRTELYLNGTHLPKDRGPDFRAETDTISRLIYGLATTYMLTGEDRFLEAAQSGTQYLRDHLRFLDEENDVVYWYHAVDVSGDGERVVFASESGDDYDAIPMYEQIYALAGPTQTYRVTGDPLILQDLDRTVRLFDKFFADHDRGGYFSHIDPVSLDPRDESLGRNRARKNWNSVGDHAPAYLINALLATGRQDFSDFLIDTGKTIVRHFPAYENSPFVQERFYEDWSADSSWGWQQNHAVVGHNLKIAWNLMRMHHLFPEPEFQALAEKIAALMPEVGSDQQRTGWYDVVDRRIPHGAVKPRFIWHDRKAWWQQEQGILAYLILAGTLGNPEYLRLAREGASFYNAMFLDHDDGGVYFNVMASGVPYLVGTERHKGSHSMSGYHSIELCYLASVYINLLINNEPLTLHFKPMPGAFPDRLLRVAPDLLPPGRVRLTDVWVDDEPYSDFDAEAMTVTLPDEDRTLRVKVRVCSAAEALQVYTRVTDSGAEVTLRGRLGQDEIPILTNAIQPVADAGAIQIWLLVHDLETISAEAVRELIFVRQHREVSQRGHLIVVGANQQVRSALEEVGRGDFVFSDHLPVSPDGSAVPQASEPGA